MVHALRVSDITGFEIEEIGHRDRQEFSALLDRSFPVPVGSHFLEDFPVWDFMGPSSVRRVGIRDGGVWVSCAAGRLAFLKTPKGRIRVGLIGAVATDSKHRGSGHASRLVQYLTESLQRDGAQLIMLWGSEQKMYERLGYRLGGEQILVPLSSIGDLTTGEGVRRGWNPRLIELLIRRPMGLAMNMDDLPWIENHRLIDWYWTGPPRAPLAYAAIGKGIDLQGLVHEWGGERADLARVLTALKVDHPSAQLMGPRFLIDTYNLWGSGAKAQQLALVNPLQIKDLPESLWVWGLDSC